MGKLVVYFALTLLIKCILLFEEATGFKCAHSPLEINLPQGEIRGFYDIKISQRQFLGIPFATAINRFEAPGKPPSWNGTFKADRGSIICKQYNELWKTILGQEDCLTLNVFTPTFQTDEKFPVMAFIHGGGFYWGSNTKWIYNPRYLVKRKVIVVTINYRVGAFGFLCLGLKEAPGNVGLKDQVAALKWIQENIIYFGGDPNSVTLFGQSSGGASVNYLIYSHSAAGLFHRAILESGTFLSPTAFSYTPIDSARKVALRLGHNTSNPEELLKIFKNKPADDIVEASHFDISANDPFAAYVFGPCIETAKTSARPLITEKPRDLLKKNGLNISVIIGFNNKEGINWARYYYPITEEKIKLNLENNLPRDLLFTNKAEKKSVTDNVKLIYFTKGSAQDNLIDYFTDTAVRHPLTVVSEALCKKPNRTLYNYYFTYDSIRNINKLITPLSAVPGADHGDELFYIFDQVLYNLIPSNSKDRAMIANIVNLWTNFAKTGVPSTSNIMWHPCGEHLNFIELGKNIKNVTLPHENRIEFWRKTYNKYGK